MTRSDLEAVHARMLRDAEAAGGRIAAVFACVHAPWEACGCRKPAPGLIEAAMSAASVPAAQTLVVGDALRDLEAARAAGVAAVLLLTGKGGTVAATNGLAGIGVYDDLLTFAQALLAAKESADD